MAKTIDTKARKKVDRAYRKKGKRMLFEHVKAQSSTAGGGETTASKVQLLVDGRVVGFDAALVDGQNVKAEDLMVRLATGGLRGYEPDTKGKLWLGTKKVGTGYNVVRATPKFAAGEVYRWDLQVRRGG